MERLLKRRNLQQRLEEVVKEIGEKTHDHISINKGDNAESHKIVSDSSTHYILIKKALEHIKKPLAADAAKEISNIKDKKNDVEEVLELDEEFSQQELFTIFGSDEQQTQTVIMYSSSSTEDSDLEEVPSQPVSPSEKKVILDIPIDPTLVYEEDDDMFADIFGTVSSQVPKSEKSIQSDFKVNSLKSDDVLASQEILESHEHIKANNTVKEIIPSHINQGIAFEENSSKLSLSDVKTGDQMEKIGPLSSSEDNRALSESHVEVIEDTKIAQMGSSKKNSPTKEDGILYCSVSLETLPSSRQLASSNSISPNDIILNEVVKESGKLDIPFDFTSATQEICEASFDNSKDFRETIVMPSTSKVCEPNVLNPKRIEELEEMSRIINQEQSALIQQHGRQARLGASITDQMYSESQVIVVIIFFILHVKIKAVSTITNQGRLVEQFLH